MAYIFLDESGQFSKENDGRYFIVGSFTVGNYRRTAKQFRSWQRSRFPRQLRNAAEIKFSEVEIKDELRLKTLRHIANLDVRIHYTYLLRENIPFEYWNKDKLQSGALYTNVIGETLKMYLPVYDKEFRVFCDQRHLKGIRRPNFKAILKAQLLSQLSKDTLIQIEMIDSTTNANIQIADWISGAIARYLEKKPSGEECFQILKNNLLKVEGKELFKQ